MPCNSSRCLEVDKILLCPFIDFHIFSLRRSFCILYFQLFFFEGLEVKIIYLRNDSEGEEVYDCILNSGLFAD